MNISALVAYSSAEEPNQYEVYRSSSTHREATRAGVLSEWAEGRLDPRTDTGEEAYTEFSHYDSDGLQRILREPLSTPLLDRDPIEVNCELSKLQSYISPYNRTMIYLVREGEFNVVVPLWAGQDVLSTLTSTTEIRLWEGPGPESPMDFEMWKAGRKPVETVRGDTYNDSQAPVPQILRENHLEILQVVERLSEFREYQEDLPTGVVDSGPYLIEVDVHSVVSDPPQGEWVFIELDMTDPVSIENSVLKLHRLGDNIRFQGASGYVSGRIEYVVEQNAWGEKTTL